MLRATEQRKGPTMEDETTPPINAGWDHFALAIAIWRIEQEIVNVWRQA
jgi:hypothetical protein